MKPSQNLDDYTNYWLKKALDWADTHWDEEQALVQMQFDNKSAPDAKPIAYAVRDSVWYATGLLMRQANGDIERATQIINSVLRYQYDVPSAVYHGKFKRYPEEPTPSGKPVIWRDYDPNWREFICTVFIIVLKEFTDFFSDDLIEKMKQSIFIAAQGSFARKVTPEYTNISLMSAFLLDYAGREYDNLWCEFALEQAQAIHQLFNRYGTFNEYNSPTYYGVDFYALALWRVYGSTEQYRTWGAEMEVVLWRDTADFYHANMRNLCGAYDRSYGMDMTEYIASLGLWIATIVPPEHAPLPDVEQAFDHAGDYFFMPMVAILGAKIPDDTLVHFRQFQGERSLERTIEAQRTVTAWLSQNIMLGAQADNLNPSRTEQFHPATLHWKIDNASIGWIRVHAGKLFQARAKPHQLDLSAQGTRQYQFEISCPQIDANMIKAHTWTLPNLTIHLQRPSTPFEVTQEADKLIVQFKADASVSLQCEMT